MVLVGIIVAMVIFQDLTAEQARRAHILIMMKSELSRLPSAGGVTEEQYIAEGDLARNPTIEVIYPQVEACSAIQDNYADEASAAGWTVSFRGNDGQYTIARYTKTVSGAHLMLSIDCLSESVSQVPYSGYYTLIMQEVS